jgi:hypothetical protein
MQGCIQHFNTIMIYQNVTHDFCCDSKSLLLRIKRTLHRPWVNLSQCLASDFDLESGILDIIVSISFQHLHVRSHQDDNIKVHLLPWEAQMNVHADAMATDHLDNCAEPSKIVPFIPASQASLTINGKTIARRHAKRLQQAASSPRTCKKLMAKNAWSRRAEIEKRKDSLFPSTYQHAVELLRVLSSGKCQHTNPVPRQKGFATDCWLSRCCLAFHRRPRTTMP